MARRKAAPEPSTDTNKLGERIKQLRGHRTLEDINKKAKIGTSRLSKLELGRQKNPRLDTLRAVARGLDRPLSDLFLETEPPDEGARDPRHIDPALERLVSQLAAPPPAGTWRSDVLDAIHALTRALRRDEDDTGTVIDRPAKSGR